MRVADPMSCPIILQRAAVRFNDDGGQVSNPCLLSLRRIFGCNSETSVRVQRCQRRSTACRYAPCRSATIAEMVEDSGARECVKHAIGLISQCYATFSATGTCIAGVRCSLHHRQFYFRFCFQIFACCAMRFARICKTRK